MSEAPRVLHYSEPSYWRQDDLRLETQRVFDICHGCRRCWNLCPSFGNLFKRIDQLEDQLNQLSSLPGAAVSGELKPEGEHAATVIDPSLASAANPVDALTDADRQRVVDECYQCKLCYNHCPYHPPHRFALDFPRLMQRAKAVQVRNQGAKLADRIFAQVDLVGRATSWVAPIVNWLNTFPPNRWLLQKALGIHPKRNLPRFYFQTFRNWWDRKKDQRSEGGVGGKNRVALFYTCSVNYNEPQTARAAVAVLEKNGFEVVCPEQRCCGMPHLDGGDIASAVASAERNLKNLVAFAKEGVPIVALGPTCSYMLKEEYPALLKTENARLVASKTYDISEFLIKLHKDGTLDTGFKPRTQKVAYHLPCHLKAQNMGFKTRELLALLPGSTVSMIDRCSAHDGTWGMKDEYYELSMKTGQKLFDEIKEASPDAVATDCPLAALQIVQGAGKSAEHPIHLVAKAYGIEIN